MIEFTCPSCGKRFSVSDQLAGRKGKCKACGAALRVPKPTPPPSTKAPTTKAPAAEPTAAETPAAKTPAAKTPAAEPTAPEPHGATPAVPAPAAAPPQLPPAAPPSPAAPPTVAPIDPLAGALGDPAPVLATPVPPILPDLPDPFADPLLNASPPIEATPIEAIPIEATPIEAIPIEATPLADAAPLLDASLLDAAGLAPAAPPPIRRRKQSVRERRLGADAKHMVQAFESFPFIQLQAMRGNPPEVYQVRYCIRGLQRSAEGSPVFRDEHLVEIQLTREYPHQSPKCRMLTPLFHPNVDPTAICVGDHWTAGERLTELVIRIGEIISYQAYNLKSPLDGEAAMWTDKNTHALPTDNRDLRPPNL